MSERIIDLYTEEALKKILKTWYPSDDIQPNERVAIEVYIILESARQCTSSLNNIKHLLGGPFGTARSLTSPVIKQIKSSLRKAGNDKHALACTLSAAGKKRSVVYEAGLF